MINKVNISSRLNNCSNNYLNKGLLRKKSIGFTLIEVMLAMAVFAIAGIALISAADSNTRNISHLENKLFASWVASNQLVEATLATTWPPKNNKKGEVTLANRTWFWQQKVLKTTDKDMRAIVMEVRMQEDEKFALASLTTYVSKAKP